MTEIGRVIAHKTTHQDGGNDELVLTGILPGVHKTTHQDAGADEIDATGLAGRCDFVDRGDPVATDYDDSAFTNDNTWRTLDLSSKVPSGAKAVLFRVITTATAVPGSLFFRKKGNSNNYNISGIRCVVADLQHSSDLIVPLSSDGMIEYRLSYNVWTQIGLNVGGWFI